MKESYKRRAPFPSHRSANYAIARRLKTRSWSYTAPESRLHGSIETHVQSINVHWGLSPYYRGILCADWAVLNRDLSNIGFTLHELSREVDGGQIITQGRVGTEAGDTIGSITYRLHHLAKSALLKAVAAAQQDHLIGVPQDLSKGRNYTSQDWTIGTSIRLSKLIPINQRAINESGPELPIYENAAFSAGGI